MKWIGWGHAYLSPMSMTVLAQRHALNVATALLFGLAVWRVGFAPELPAVLAFIFGGVLLSVIDWKVHRLPTRLVYLTLAGVAAGLVLASLLEWNWKPLGTAVLGAVLMSNAFFLLWFVGRRFASTAVIGFGDVRLAAVLGLLLGWYGLRYVLYGAVAGHLLAVAVVLGTCIRTRKLYVRYSFGPSLIAGTLAVVLVRP